MELQFKKRTLSCLETCLREVQSGEETLEIRLQDGQPDIGKVLGAWGQPILRSKEWRSDQLAFSGGMMVWVLYQPEQGGEPQCLEGWIPYSMRWDLPVGSPEGTIRLRLSPRFVDARTTSARKVMVRSGLAAEVEAWTSREAELYEQEDGPEELQLLREKYPLRLIREAGEKAFQLSEELTLPQSAPKPDRLISYCLRPEITEKKIIANKLVFRGNGDLHLLYAAEDGQLHTWELPLMFSQYAELDGSYAGEAVPELSICVTSLEVYLDPEGGLSVKSAMTAQYLVVDQEVVEVVSDAYAPGRELRAERQRLSVPVVLDSWRENVEAERSLPGAADIAVETMLTVDQPRQRPGDGQIQLELTGLIQTLYYGPDGIPGAASGRFETKHTVKADPSCTLLAQPMKSEEPQLSLGSDAMEARIQIPVQFTVLGTTDLEMIAAVTLGDRQEPDPDRPSLIIKRAGKEGLWELAKASGSTVEAIRKTNSLREDPDPQRLLLIPVP